MSTLLEDVIIAHGGLVRWKALTTVQATIVTGGAFWCSPPCGSGSAVTWRKARAHERAAVGQPRHLRASGDLAYKKIFPALQAMMRRGISRGRLLGDAMGGDATPLWRG